MNENLVKVINDNLMMINLAHVEGKEDKDWAGVTLDFQQMNIAAKRGDLRHLIKVALSKDFSSWKTYDLIVDHIYHYILGRAFDALASQAPPDAPFITVMVPVKTYRNAEPILREIVPEENCECPNHPLSNPDQSFGD
jgi:hypothetical protein